MKNINGLVAGILLYGFTAMQAGAVPLEAHTQSFNQKLNASSTSYTHTFDFLNDAFTAASFSLNLHVPSNPASKNATIYFQLGAFNYSDNSDVFMLSGLDVFDMLDRDTGTLTFNLWSVKNGQGGGQVNVRLRDSTLSVSGAPAELHVPEPGTLALLGLGLLGGVLVRRRAR